MNCRSEIAAEAKEDFHNVIMPRTKQAIKELVAETDKGFQKQCRIEYLQGKMADTIVETWEFLDRYEDYKHREKMIELLLAGEKAQQLVKEIVKLQGEIIGLRNNGEKKTGLSQDDIERARQHPFESLLEFKRNVTRCPFHEDREPSMHLYREQNRVHCFSCNRSWDTIQFLRDRDSLSFVEAVKYLI